MLDWEAIGNALLLIVAALAAFGSALWLALIIWTFRDMRARSRDLFAQVLAAAVVAVLNIPGLIIYLILRPRETLAQAYERSLEEEALLQSIEEKPVCPGCGRASREHWQVCPYCHTKLKKVCVTCGELLQLSWNICPHCASSQLGYAPGETTTERRRAKSKLSRVQKPAKQEVRPESYIEDTVYSGSARQDRTALYPEEAYLAGDYAPDDYTPEPEEAPRYEPEPGYAAPEKHNARRSAVRADVVQFIEDDDF
ncbi:MAG: hypothetical protein Kow00120_04900 [Anaerolineae bacterium]